MAGGAAARMVAAELTEFTGGGGGLFGSVRQPDGVAGHMHESDEGEQSEQAPHTLSDYGRLRSTSKTLYGQYVRE